MTTYYEWKAIRSGRKLPEKTTMEQPKCYVVCDQCKVKFFYGDRICLACFPRPDRMVLVTETTGFVPSNGRTGPLFEWFRLLKDNTWKHTHILHNDNWMLAL